MNNAIFVRLKTYYEKEFNPFWNFSSEHKFECSCNQQFNRRKH